LLISNAVPGYEITVLWGGMTIAPVFIDPTVPPINPGEESGGGDNSENFVPIVPNTGIKAP